MNISDFDHTLFNQFQLLMSTTAAEISVRGILTSLDTSAFTAGDILFHMAPELS